MFYIYANGNLIYRPLEPELNLLNPKLTLEMGKAGSLEFGLPSFNKYYDSLSPLVTDIKVELDDEEIFFGRVLSSKKAFNNVKTVYCEGDLAYLVDSVQKCTAYNGNTHELFSKIVAAHNARVENKKQFTVGNVTIENRSVKLTGQSDGMNVGNIDYKQIAIDSIVDEWNNTYDFIKTTLIDYCGGYLRTRHENGVAYLDYVQDYFGTTSQMIELGSNLLDLNDELKVDEIFTVLIPLGDDNLTIKNVNNGSDELVDETLVQKYGRIVKTHVFSNVNSPSTLKENALRFMASNAKSVRTLEISAVDLHLINPNIQPIHLGDKVRIFSMPHDMDEELTCTKIEYDLTNPGNNKYTFGNPQQTLTERYREDARKQSDTYGNSAAASSTSGGRSGGGAGAAAAAAADAAGKESEEKADESLTQMFETYIDVDDADLDGHITLQTIYNKLQGCGIYLNPKLTDETHGGTPNIDIRAFSKEYDTNKQTVIDREASIRLEIENDYNSKISVNADSIELNANKIVQINSDLVNIDGRLEAAEAKFNKFYADDGTAVTLTVSHLGVSSITASGKVQVGSLQVVDPSAGSISINGALVPTENHSHIITPNDDGTVTFGNATTSPQSFNQASTTFFKTKIAEAKKSVTIRTIDRDTSKGTQGLDWITDKVCRIYLYAYTSENIKGENSILISASHAYEAGQAEAHTHYHGPYYRYEATGYGSYTEQGIQCGTALYTQRYNPSTHAYDYTPYTGTLYYGGSTVRYMTYGNGAYYYTKD